MARRDWWLGLGLALTIVASLVVTAGVRALILSGVPIPDPVVFYFPIVILATLHLGWQWGVLALVLQVILADFFLIEPLYQLAPRTTVELTTDAIFVTAGGLVVLITARLKRALTRAERLAQENRDLYEAEREQRRLRELFIGVLSHDLRTPLTVMKGALQLAQRRAQRQGGQVDAAVLTTVEQEVSRLVRMLDELLDFQRLQHGSLGLRRAPLDLVALTRAVVARVQTIFPDHTLRVRAEVPEAWVDADATRLEQALTNLLTNAAKYSPGQPWVDVTITLQEGRPTVLVQDYGIGIAPDEQEKLFTPFYRTQEAKQTGITGTGLGLYIARQIVELHGGTLRMTSSPGKGTVVACTFPPAVPAAQPTPAATPLSESAGYAKVQQIPTAWSHTARRGQCHSRDGLGAGPPQAPVLWRPGWAR
ncbi:MAG: HAMP domain-containing histidine kinase [Chloroflexi bacterium]|nr:HAMP domain-containing histidine kinase [Chloroflexota bacterium]